jgi:type I restriction enzyme M protein
MKADGYSLDDKRTFIDGKGDIPDIIGSFNKRDSERFEERKANCFFVPVEEIRDNNYDLSCSRYKEIEYKEAVYDEPEVIKLKILELENKITQTLQEMTLS